MEAPRKRTGRRSEWGRERIAIVVTVGARLLAAMIAAGVAGFLIGGIGGRLAMLLLRLTSGPEVVGLESDDGFVIGRFSLDTVNLVLGVTLGSMLVAGPIYALIRMWLPARGRPVLLAILFALVGGSVLVHRDGVDFVVLTPRPLAIGVFVAIPAAFGAALEPLHAVGERMTALLPRIVLLGVVVLPSTVPILVGVDLDMSGLGVIAMTGGVWVLLLFGPAERIGRAIMSRPAAVAGRVALAAVAGLAADDLLMDVRSLLALG